MAGKIQTGIYNEEKLKKIKEKHEVLTWSLYKELSENQVSDNVIKRLFGLSDPVFRFWKTGHISVLGE